MIIEKKNPERMERKEEKTKKDQKFTVVTMSMNIEKSSPPHILVFNRKDQKLAETIVEHP